MAKKKTETDPVKELSVFLRQLFEELFGECIDNEGVFRARIDGLGVSSADAIIEVMLEEGLRDDAPYGVLHFATTLAEDIPDEYLADILISLNSLNHVISAGAMPGFGCFCYYEPLSQIYLSYRMPVNLLQIDAEYDNIRYYLSSLLDQLDLLTDFVMFMIAVPGSMYIQDYMDYLDQVTDLNDLTLRMQLLSEAFNEIEGEAGIGPEETEEMDAADIDPQESADLHDEKN